VIYELCVGKPPFDGANMQSLQSSIMKCKYKAIPSGYSRELANLIGKMLKIRPSDRPSAQSILDDFVVD